MINEKEIKDNYLEKINLLKNKFPLLSTFEYLGVTFSVVGHFENYLSLYISYVFPKLLTEYVDVNGVIQKKSFDCDLAMLINNGR